MGTVLAIAVDSRGGTPDGRYDAVASALRGPDATACTIFTTAHGSSKGNIASVRRWLSKIKESPGEPDMKGMADFLEGHRMYNPIVVRFETDAAGPGAAAAAESDSASVGESIDDIIPRGQPRTGTVILLGETGVGKSTLGNALLGSDGVFVEGGGINSVTRGVSVHKMGYGSFTLTVMDTPGLNDTAGQDSTIAAIVQEGAAVIQDCIAFIYVFNATSPRLGDASKAALLNYKSHLTSALKRSLIIVGNTQGAPIAIHEESAMNHARSIAALLESDPMETEIILMSVKPSVLHDVGATREQLQLEASRRKLLMRCVFEARDYVDMQVVSARIKQQKDAQAAMVAQAAVDAKYQRKKERSRRHKARLGAVIDMGIRVARSMAGLPM